MAFEHISEPINRVLADIIERNRREIIRDEAHAHIIIEDALEAQQIEGSRAEAFERIQREVNARLWDNLTDRDMTFFSSR